jgi:hypothetical protein
VCDAHQHLTGTRRRNVNLDNLKRLACSKGDGGA